MLQYPINVYPDKVAFDPANADYDRGLHFDFKGDMLNAIYLRVYDYDSQAMVINTVICEPDLSPLAYNNDGVDITNAFSSLTTGRSYILQMMLCQVYKQGSGESAFYDGIYDRFVSRGETTADYTQYGDTLYIENGINVIYEWIKVGNIHSGGYISVEEGGVTEDILVAGMTIEINGESRAIASYNRETGALTLDMAFWDDIPKGTPYKLMASYLITEQYFFQTVETPQIQNVAVTDKAYGLEYTGFYSQPSRDMLRYYTLKLYKKTSNTVYILTQETPKIYSQNIKYVFVDDYDFAGLGGNDTTREYRIVFDGVLHNGMTVTSTYDFTAAQRSATQIITEVYPHVALTSDNIVNVDFIADSTVPMGTGFRVYRINADGLYNPETSPHKLYIDYQQIPQKQLVYDGSGYGGFKDCTASNKGNYRYMAVPYKTGDNETLIYAAVLSDVINLDMDGYTITAVYDTNQDADNLQWFRQGDTWKFIADIEDTTHTQNTSKELHVGYGKYSTLTSTDVDYASGTLSGMLGYLNCTTKQYIDDIELVKAWRRFITQNCQYVLRSPKGDVWVVNIVENPTTQYQENTTKYPTRFTFSWAECGDIKGMLIQGATPPRTTERR